MVNNSFEEIWNKLKGCKKVVMTLHYGPDGDSLGSCCAMKYVLERDLKAKVDLISFDSLPDELEDLPYKKEVQFGIDISDVDLKKYDAVLFLDVASLDFASKLKNEYVLDKNIFSFNIDHHYIKDNFTTMKYADKDAPSACSVLVELFKSINVKFDTGLCNRLLLGICTDSGFFTYDTNPERALREALFLIDHSADYINSVLKPVSYNKSLKSQKYRAIVINNIKINKKYRLGYSSIPYSDVLNLELNEAEVRDAPSVIRNIKEFDFIFTLTEMKDYIKGSFRLARGIDVSLFAKELSGHGHRSAAGFFLPKMPLEDAEKKVLDVIKKVGIHRE